MASYASLYQLDESITNFRVVEWNVTTEVKLDNVSKQWRTYSDAAFCDI